MKCVLPWTIFVLSNCSCFFFFLWAFTFLRINLWNPVILSLYCRKSDSDLFVWRIFKQNPRGRRVRVADIHWNEHFIVEVIWISIQYWRSFLERFFYNNITLHASNFCFLMVFFKILVRNLKNKQAAHYWSLIHHWNLNRVQHTVKYSNTQVIHTAMVCSIDEYK